MTYAVNVTNTGGVDADDVVLGFMTPPGAGSNGVPLQVLFGFERVHVKAGETKQVLLYPAATDFVQVMPGGQRVALSGTYHMSFGVKDTESLGMGFAEATVVAV